MREDDCCCSSGPPQNDRQIYVDGMLFRIFGEGDDMYCIFENLIDGRTEVCPDPPPVVVDAMNKLR